MLLRRVFGLSLTLFALLGEGLLEPERCLGQSLRVELTDGRLANGQLSRRTNQNELCLYATTSEIQLHSAFAWSDIRTVKHAGKSYTASEFRAVVSDIGPNINSDPTPPIEPEPPRAPPLHDARLPTSRIASLQIEVALARWDAFVPASGLVVTITPITANAAATAVRGDLHLTLWAAAWPATRGPVDRTAFREVARAYHIVRPADFSGGRATYRLPFDQLHPEFDLAIEPYGLVHARLGVNGQGVVEASDPFVRLREFSPVRDRRQLLFQPRFFPGESTGWPYR